jgi:hypothetical protein
LNLCKNSDMIIKRKTVTSNTGTSLNKNGNIKK